MRAVCVRGLSNGDPILSLLERTFGRVDLVSEMEGLGSLDPYDALVIGLPVGESLVTDALTTAVERGLRVLFVAPEAESGAVEPALRHLTGVTDLVTHRRAEWIAEPVAGHAATARLSSDVPVSAGFTELVVDDSATVLASVNIAMTHRSAIAYRVLGDGAVSTLGFQRSVRLSESIERLLTRCLSPQLEASSSDIGIGVIGYGPLGGMGHRHGHALEVTDGLRFAAAVDTDIERLKVAEQMFPGVRTHRTVDELLLDDAVDAVVVATPPVSHTELTRRVLESGRSVVAEKPLCFTVAQADELIALADANGVSLTVHQNRRWDRDFRTIRRVIDDGTLGEVFNVETFVGSFEHPCRHWHSEVEISGGAVYDWGSHHIDWILQLMGESPTRVRTHAHKRVWHDVTNVDQVRVHLEFADGREAEFFQSDLAAIRRPKFWIQGTDGTLCGHYEPKVFERMVEPIGFVSEPAHHAEAPASLTMARYESGLGVTETALPLVPDVGFAFHRNLADHLQMGEPLAVTAASVRQVIAVLEAVQTSLSRSGTEVGVDDLV